MKDQLQSPKYWLGKSAECLLQGREEEAKKSFKRGRQLFLSLSLEKRDNLGLTGSSLSKLTGIFDENASEPPAVYFSLWEKWQSLSPEMLEWLSGNL